MANEYIKFENEEDAKKETPRTKRKTSTDEDEDNDEDKSCKDGDDGREDNPFNKANFFSRSIFLWLNPFIRRGFSKRLEFSDLYKPPDEDLSEDLGRKLESCWRAELARASSTKAKASLLRAIIKAFGFWYMVSGLWVAVGECIVRPLQAIALGWMIRDANVYLSMVDAGSGPGPGSGSEEAAKLAAYWQVLYDGLYLILFSTVSLITVHPYLFCTQHVGMKIRIACCHIIYRHALKLSSVALKQTTVGQMVNLLSNDVNRFDSALIYIQYLLVAPIQAIVVVAILSTHFLGVYATMAGATVLLLYVPFQSLMGRWFGRLRLATAARTDERIRLMNEIVPAMRVIKMYTWEDSFARLVELARKNEVQLIKRTSVLRAINMALFFVSSKLIVFISLITYVLLGYSLQPELVFVAITMFNAVRLLMTLFFPYGVAQLAETLISIERLQRFLELPERESSRYLFQGPNDGLRVSEREIRVEAASVSANWISYPALQQLDADGKLAGQDASKGKADKVVAAKVSAGAGVEPAASTALRELTFELTAGELMIIVGPVGSGKSSVLLSILGELPLASGKLTTSGLVSYAAQEAWIFGGSVRENVLFGKAYKQARYEHVLRACSLDRDLELFPQGDATIVGERGVSLSGGQRARINLARAIYYDADIYLLDDPLSAVDSLVAKHIFNECICDFLKQKAVILATHQTQFVRKDTKVLYLEQGRMVSCKQGLANKDLQAFIGSNWERSDSESANMSGANKQAAAKQRRQAADSPPGHLLESAVETVETVELEEQKSRSISDHSSNGSDEQQATGGLGESPIRQQGAESSLAADSVGLPIYWHYIRASAGPAFVLVMLLANILTQLLFNGCDYWLSLWTDTEQRRSANGVSPAVSLTDSLTLQQSATVYTSLIGLLFLLSLIRTSCFFVACMRASIRLHNKLFESVLRAPIKFFDYNPIGVLLNRASRDMGIVDDLLPPTAFDTLEIFVNVLGTLVTVAIVYALNALPALGLFAALYLIRLFYMRSVRSIKSIEGATRSPVFSHLASSLNGLTTIRAFRLESQFEAKFDQHQDVHTSAWFLFVAASRWLGITLDWLSLAYIGVITIIMSLSVGSTTSSQLALAVSSAVSLSGSFQWGVRQSTEMESQMTSVARIKEYSELPEEPARISTNPPPAEWPQRGQIEFKQVNLRYFEDEAPVLRALNFTINAGERVGIVGRTGAGKSSIIAVLFRLTEPEGSILIDGLDTKRLGLHELRRELAIIPQEPVLFSGSLRMNLDPFGGYSDADVWLALDQVGLAAWARRQDGALSSSVKEGGSNLSVGERQLVCLARAVLRKNRIIILDEATANVDLLTDKMIQRTISRSFEKCTRLTIAHRLNTIMDSDRVLVMDSGQVREFDAPHLLLANEAGLFTTMVNNTGKHASHLKRLAKSHFEKRQQAGKVAEAVKSPTTPRSSQ